MKKHTCCECRYAQRDAVALIRHVEGRVQFVCVWCYDRLGYAAHFDDASPVATAIAVARGA